MSHCTKRSALARPIFVMPSTGASQNMGVRRGDGRIRRSESGVARGEQGGREGGRKRGKGQRAGEIEGTVGPATTVHEDISQPLHL